MKIAQEIRAGNVIMQNGAPWVVLRTEYARGGRNAATVRMKLKSLLNNFGTEVVFKADDKMDQIILDKKECTYSYFADPMYVCMDSEYNQYEVEAENMGDALNYLEDGMAVEVWLRLMQSLLPCYVKTLNACCHTQEECSTVRYVQAFTPNLIETAFEMIEKKLPIINKEVRDLLCI